MKNGLILFLFSVISVAGFANETLTFKTDMVMRDCHNRTDGTKRCYGDFSKPNSIQINLVEYNGMSTGIWEKKYTVGKTELTGKITVVKDEAPSFVLGNKYVLMLEIIGTEFHLVTRYIAKDLKSFEGLELVDEKLILTDELGKEWSPVLFVAP